MSSPIEVKGQFRGQILETLHQLNRNAAKQKTLMAELEEVAQNAATAQGVDLKLFVLDIDSLQFTERALPVPQAINEKSSVPTNNQFVDVAKGPAEVYPKHPKYADAVPANNPFVDIVKAPAADLQGLRTLETVPDSTGDSVTTE